MNYQWHYDQLMITRKSRIPEKGQYYERHHILPRSMGGDNSSENLVTLTAREHFLAHWLLWRIHRNREMGFAFWNMCNGNKKQSRVTSSRIYLEAKEASSFARKNSDVIEKMNTSLGSLGRSNRSKSGWKSCSNREERLNNFSKISAEKSILKGIERRKNSKIDTNLTTRSTNKILHCNKDGLIINIYENANNAALKLIEYSRSFIYRSVKYGHKMYDETYFINKI